MQADIDYQELAKKCQPFLEAHPEFLTVAGIQQRFQVSRTFIYNLINDGTLKPYAFEGKDSEGNDNDSRHSRTFIKVVDFEGALKPKKWTSEK